MFNIGNEFWKIIHAKGAGINKVTSKLTNCSCGTCKYPVGFVQQIKNQYIGILCNVVKMLHTPEAM